MKSLAPALLFAASLLLPAPAAAEVANVKGSGNSRMSACSKAKYYARERYTHKYSKVTNFGTCDCEKPRRKGALWTCSVDVYFRRK